MIKPNYDRDKDVRSKVSLKAKMDTYTEKMKTISQGRIHVRKFSPQQDVLVANHVGKTKWFGGTIVEQIADRTYSVSIRGEMFKRHVDDIIPRYWKSEEYQEEDSWVHEYPNDDTTSDASRRPPETHTRRYPARSRRPVDRYGMSKFV